MDSRLLSWIIILGELIAFLLNSSLGSPQKFPRIFGYHGNAIYRDNLVFKMDTATTELTNLTLLIGMDENTVSANSIAKIFCYTSNSVGFGLHTILCQSEVDRTVFSLELPHQTRKFVVRGHLSQLNPYGDHLVWQDLLTRNLFVTNLRSKTSFLLLSDYDGFSKFTLDWNNGILYGVSWKSSNQIEKLRLPKDNYPNNKNTIGPNASVKLQSPSPIKGLTCRSDANETVYWIASYSLFQATSDGNIVKLWSDFNRDPIFHTLQYYSDRIYFFQRSDTEVLKDLMIYDTIKRTLESKSLGFRHRRLRHVVIYEDQTGGVPNECANLNCSHICIPYYKSRFQCVCPWGLELVEGRHCRGIEVVLLTKTSSDFAVTRYDLGLGLNESVNTHCQLGDSFSLIVTNNVYEKSNGAVCFINVSTIIETKLPAYLAIFPVKHVPAYSRYSPDGSFYWVNDKSCIQRQHVNSSISWSLVCLRGLGSGQIALDIDNLELFWENERRSGFRTQLRENKTTPFNFFDPKKPRGREPSNLVALDVKSRKVYILSNKFLNITNSWSSSVKTVAYAMQSYDGDAHSDLYFLHPRIYWIEHYTALMIDYIITFDPTFGLKERILMSSNTILRFNVLATSATQFETGSCAGANCSHFCSDDVSTKFTCFCPVQLPILINGSQCTLSPYLVATRQHKMDDTLSLRLVSTPLETGNPEDIVIGNIYNSDFYGTQWGNSWMICKTPLTFLSSQINCDFAFSNKTHTISLPKNSVKVVAMEPRRGGFVYFQTLSDGCIHLYSFKLQASLKAACVKTPATSSLTIDTVRQIIFWYQSEAVLYQELGKFENSAAVAMDKWDGPSGEYRAVAVNSEKAELIVIKNLSIIAVEYSRFGFRDKDISHLYLMTATYNEGLQCYRDRIFWIAGTAVPGEFIESFSIGRTAWGKAVGSSNFHRLYKSKGERIFRFQILESLTQERDSISPCDLASNECKYFCIVSDPLPPVKTHAATCFCPTEPRVRTSHLECNSTGSEPDLTDSDSPVESVSLFLVYLLALIVGLTVVGILVLGFYLRARNAEKTRFRKDLTDLIIGDNQGLVQASSLNGPERALLAPFKMVIPPEQIKLNASKILGSGNFGLVYSGRYNGIDVALKTIKYSSNHELVEHLLLDFIRELKIMAFIGDHESVVKFYGADISGIDAGKIFAVLELSSIGSLKKYLEVKKESRLTASTCKTKGREMEKIGDECNLMISWAKQIAAGMRHLEEKNVAHGDLATRNVLVFEDGKTVKISDFGLSKNLYQSEYYRKHLKIPLPFRWSAIETLERREFSSKADVWSYGVTIWEIFTFANLPYADCEWDEHFVLKLKTGMRLSKPSSDVAQAYEKIMLPCWQIQPSDRPSFSSLEQICVDLLKEQQLYLQGYDNNLYVAGGEAESSL